MMHNEHYKKLKHEPIDVIEEWARVNKLDGAQGFAYGCLLKYLARINLKGQTEKDLDKSRYYLKRFSKLILKTPRRHQRFDYTLDDINGAE